LLKHKNTTYVEFIKLAGIVREYIFRRKKKKKNGFTFLMSLSAVLVLGLAMGSCASGPASGPPAFVQIQGGTFTMGSPENEKGRVPDEGPQHQVTVSGFFIGKYEVTQKEYMEVMGTNPSEYKGNNLPVENISWYEAVEYCNRRSQKEGLTPAYTIDKSMKDPNNKSRDDKVKWLVTWNRNANGYRLPTEAEWEYACRAGTTTRYWSGNDETSLAGIENVLDLTAMAKYSDLYRSFGVKAVNIHDGYADTSPVGSFAANPWGLYDMHGNVSEWCWDWDGMYASGAETDPVGASYGETRISRGGNLASDAGDLRSANRRSNIDPSDRNYGLGFRLVRH
jgi:formylglycine-generating enzyme required for sulfatase activity